MIQTIRFGMTQLGMLAGLFGMYATGPATAQEACTKTCQEAAATCTKQDGETTCCKQATAVAMDMKTMMESDMHKTGMFMGEKANTGFAMHAVVDGRQVLMLSDDFVTPDTPAPHWQVIDSEGNVYLLNRLKIKGDKYNQTIMLPGYIHDVAKIQIWCAWAEALLGEATFEKPVGMPAN